MLNEYGIALYVGGVILLGVGMAEYISIVWHWKYSKAVLYLIVAVAAMATACIWFSK